MPSADGNRDVGFPSAGEDTSKPSFQRGYSESMNSDQKVHVRSLSTRPRQGLYPEKGEMNETLSAPMGE
jgi:hypothetical protein